MELHGLQNAAVRRLINRFRDNQVPQQLISFPAHNREENCFFPLLFRYTICVEEVAQQPLLLNLKLCYLPNRLF